MAATYSLTLLFLRTPLLSAVGALPTLLSAGRVQQAEYLLADTVSRRLPAAGTAPALADSRAARRLFSLSG
ncbi:hypothetical protein DMB90_03465 [Raoultella planticola]|uniref:Uncharacterized protein n=1 Tax=Raoultella planticola TaxID=575 RepID=A0A5P6A976_RAOPL|nr:hypothetical protein DMB90_03465 [Raoultella planticola]